MSLTIFLFKKEKKEKKTSVRSASDSIPGMHGTGQPAKVSSQVPVRGSWPSDQS